MPCSHPSILHCCGEEGEALVLCRSYLESTLALWVFLREMAQPVLGDAAEILRYLVLFYPEKYKVPGSNTGCIKHGVT